MTRPFLTLLGAGLLALCACAKPSEPPVGEPVAEVETATAERGDLAITVAGYGTIDFDPAAQRVLSTEIDARVAAVLVQPGAAVERGQSLLRLGPSSSTGLDLTQAREDAAAARSELARQQRLRADGLASDADVEQAATRARDLAARSAMLSENVGTLRRLRSPMDGVVDRIFVATGDIVAAGGQLLKLAAPDAVQARISLEAEDASRLAVGDPLEISTLDGAAHRAESRISEIDARVDPDTRMATVLASVPSGRGFLAGEAVRAEMVAEVRQDVVLVPREAVLNDETGPYVFLAQQGQAKRRRVQTGEGSRSSTEILSGLAAGDTVITRGNAVLSDGMKLKVRPARSAPPDASPP